MAIFILQFLPPLHGKGDGRIFFSRVNFLCWLLFVIYSTATIPQWHMKDPGHSAKIVSGMLHLNTHTPLTQWSWRTQTMLSRHSMGIHLGNKLTCTSPRNAGPVISAHCDTVDWSWPKQWTWSLTTLWQTDELSQSVPMYKDASLNSKQIVNKASGCVIFKNNSKVLWSCADQTSHSNACGAVYFACLSRGS